MQVQDKEHYPSKYQKMEIILYYDSAQTCLSTKSQWPGKMSISQKSNWEAEVDSEGTGGIEEAIHKLLCLCEANN